MVGERGGTVRVRPGPAASGAGWAGRTPVGAGSKDRLAEPDRVWAPAVRRPATRLAGPRRGPGARVVVVVSPGRVVSCGRMGDGCVV